MIKIGIIREWKTPPDARVPLTPEQCASVKQKWPVELVIQPSPVRCFKDEEYQQAGITLQEDLSDCDILLGVKEVPVDKLIPEKTYLFFSHTIKKQAYNRNLLRAVLAQKIRLIDYEVLTDELGDRLIAFGFYAGVVGAHNGVWAYGKKTGLFELPRMCDSHDYKEVKAVYQQVKWPPMRVVLTGGGRVAAGALRSLHDMGFHAVSPRDFLHKEYPYPVFTQLFAQDYVQHKSGPAIFNKAHFYQHGNEYISTFAPYYRCADIFMNGIFYDPKAPTFFTLEEMKNPDFRIKVIADITCDIAPVTSVPSTLRPSKIADPVYGFDPIQQCETSAFLPNCVDVMAIDNLPSELPRDASGFFGKQLIDNVLDELLKGKESAAIARGIIAQNGALTERYAYLADYVAE
jgi:saccharopine dehydrogenase (NAD+, L-lysine-forming)